ncbi:MAG: hypothetical protein ABGX21_03410 [Candidatus Poseidoniia archaeon]
MVFECNIDARGKSYRLKYGIYGIIVGLVVSGVLVLADVGIWMVWLIPTGLVGGGVFAVFEGWSGWCVARALGFWTPI